MVVFQAIFCKSTFLIYSYLIYWSLHTRSVKLINTMYGPLKASSLLGGQAGSTGISSALLCTVLVELPCVLPGWRMPPTQVGRSQTTFFIIRKEGGKNRKRNNAQPWLIQSISISGWSPQFGAVNNNNNKKNNSTSCPCTPLLLPSNPAALELVLWSSGSHFAQ